MAPGRIATAQLCDATISLEYERANERAIRVYHRLGFRETAKRPTEA
jgi:ribosomal protein S18 acetylase RimI-like enzyme